MQARRPDIVAKMSWEGKKKKPIYKDAQDVREDESSKKPAAPVPAGIHIPKKKHLTRAQRAKQKEEAGNEGRKRHKVRELKGGCEL